MDVQEQVTLETEVLAEARARVENVQPIMVQEEEAAIQVEPASRATKQVEAAGDHIMLDPIRQIQLRLIPETEK